MRIHMLGIGGTGMGSLAGLLLEAGHTVTGTDEKLYPPMSAELLRLGIKPLEGYRPSNIPETKPELAVIGNVIRRENPEAQEVMKLGIPYRSMPETLFEFFLKNRTRMVIAGTHGKTTSSTLAAWLLNGAGENPGFLIGGVGLNLDKSYSASFGHFFIVEGDEYDTAFFDKGPKFLHYRPDVLLITSIEFDHADIYANLSHMTESFRKLVSIVPPAGLIVANAEDPGVMEVVKEANCRIVTYGIDAGNCHAQNVRTTNEGTSFGISSVGGVNFNLPMWGFHNLSNAVGVLSMLRECKVSQAKLAESIGLFKGVKRRQEIVGDIRGITVVDDFAHHPTAVRKTIESMRLRFPGRRLWAIFEPRSNTSKRNIFQKGFAAALGSADRVIVAKPYRVESIPSEQRFDPAAVALAITKTGIDAHYIPDTSNIVEFVMRGVSSDDVILIMSNGGFDGLPSKLMEAVKKRKYVMGNKMVFGI